MPGTNRYPELTQQQPGQLCSESCTYMSQSRQNVLLHSGQRYLGNPDKSRKHPAQEDEEESSSVARPGPAPDPMPAEGPAEAAAAAAAAEISSNCGTGNRWWYDLAR